MDIFNKLKISYEAKVGKGELMKFSFLVDGEDVLIKKPNFSQISLNEQVIIVDSFIVKHRLRCKTKEFVNRKWEEVENNNILQ